MAKKKISLEDLEKEAEKEAAYIIRDMLGSGYVESYYRSLAAPIKNLVSHFFKTYEVE